MRSASVVVETISSFAPGVEELIPTEFPTKTSVPSKVKFELPPNPPASLN